MSRAILKAIWAVVVLILLGTSGAIGADDGDIRPRIHAKGRIHRDLEALSPWGAEVRNEKSFIALWRAWGAGGQPPKVDFRREFVLAFARRCNYAVPRVDVKAGDLGLTITTDNEMTPDAVFFIAVYPLDRVRTIGGKPRPPQ